MTTSRNLFTMVVASLLLAAFTNTQAQFSVLYSFTGPGGNISSPKGSLTLSGSTLFGTDANRGQDKFFKVNINGTGFQLLRSFSGSGSAGGPDGWPIVSGSTLYGVFRGGMISGDYGVVFKMNTDGTGFTTLHTFDQADLPLGSLTLSGSVLYGMTSNGDSQGTIYKINSDGTGYQVIHSFTTGEGSRPTGSLTLSGSTLYGMAGSQGVGTVFKVKTDGSGFQVLHTFGVAPDGNIALGSLALSASTLYGMTFNGGTTDRGTIFKINTDGTGYTILHNFTGDATDGGYPRGSLTLSGSTLYGMTFTGGSNNRGTVFQINTSGAGFQILHSFTGGAADGGDPFGSLTLSGSTLYGIAQTGGSSGYGIVFALDIGGGGCSYSISPTSATYGSGAGSGSVSVTAGSGCGWTATSNAGWITITSGNSGTGNGTVNYSVAVNGEAGTRSSTISVAGALFTITQSGTVPIGPVILTTSPLPNGAVGSTYGLTLTATGGSAPYTWLVVSNSLPAGLSLDSNTGEIAGTPLEITTTDFTVRLIAADGQTSQKSSR